MSKTSRSDGTPWARRAPVVRLPQPPKLGPDGEIGAFLEDLHRQDRAPLTRLDYGRDLDLFKRWYEQTAGEPMLARNVIDEDMQGCGKRASTEIVLLYEDGQFASVVFCRQHTNLERLAQAAVQTAQAIKDGTTRRV
jgi:hypothetical protein